MLKGWRCFICIKGVKYTNQCPNIKSRDDFPDSDLFVVLGTFNKIIFADQ